MKKLLAILLATFSIAATAKETITLAYSWTAADKAANFYRALADEANKLQTQYTFVFDPKPGAGGTVAANYTTNNPSNTLWINSSAGFIRPNLLPADSHSMADFRSILPGSHRTYHESVCLFLVLHESYSKIQPRSCDPIQT
jgi:tripartite-type tricarboxylate transporter receptor subunit TctC